MELGGSNVGRGYIYPFKNDFEGTTKTYDPYNDPTEMAGGIAVDGRVSSFRPSPLYNKTAVEDGKFVPISYNSDFYYVMPTADDMQQMTNYFGYLFAAKMCTREIAQTTGAGGDAFAYDKYTAITRGETQQQGTNYYTANISGFNLRTLGAYDPSNHTYRSLGSSACLILDSKQYPAGIDYLEFTISSAWRTDFKVQRGDNESEQPNNYLLQENQYAWSNVFATQFFAQVRLLMKYRNQADTGGSRSLHSSFTHIHPQKACNVYVPLEAME